MTDHSISTERLKTYLKLAEEGDFMAQCDLEDMALELARELLSLREAERWIPVGPETMPITEGVEYWVWLIPHPAYMVSETAKVEPKFTPYARVVSTWRNAQGVIRFNCGATEKPTHYRPLPSPPSIQGDSVPDRRGR